MKMDRFHVSNVGRLGRRRLIERKASDWAVALLPDLFPPLLPELGLFHFLLKMERMGRELDELSSSAAAETARTAASAHLFLPSFLPPIACVSKDAFRTGFSIKLFLDALAFFLSSPHTMLPFHFLFRRNKRRPIRNGWILSLFLNILKRNEKHTLPYEFRMKMIYL